MESVVKFAIQYDLKFVMLEKYQKNLLEVELIKILGDHETLSKVCHVGLHVDFSSMKSSLGL